MLIKVENKKIPTYILPLKCFNLHLLESKFVPINECFVPVLYIKRISGLFYEIGKDIHKEI